jgi:hypothetical protein
VAVKKKSITALSCRARKVKSAAAPSQSRVSALEPPVDQENRQPMSSNRSCSMAGIDSVSCVLSKSCDFACIFPPNRGTFLLRLLLLYRLWNS